MSSDESAWCPNLTLHKDAFWTKVPQEVVHANYTFYLMFCYDTDHGGYHIFPYVDDSEDDVYGYEDEESEDEIADDDESGGEDYEEPDEIKESEEVEDEEEELNDNTSAYCLYHVG